MIITLCGSARFEPWFHAWNEALSLAGHQVFGLASYPSQHNGVREWYTPEEKKVLDEVHKKKIAASDAILVINAFAYIGESTLGEIEYAKSLTVSSQNSQPRCQVYMLESWAKGLGISGNHFLHVRDAAERYGVPLNASPISTFHYPDVWRTELIGAGGPRRWSILRRLKARMTEALGYEAE